MQFEKQLEDNINHILLEIYLYLAKVILHFFSALNWFEYSLHHIFFSYILGAHIYSYQTNKPFPWVSRTALISLRWVGNSSKLPASPDNMFFWLYYIKHCNMTKNEPALPKCYQSRAVGLAVISVSGLLYLRLVSRCCKNCPSWLQALTRRLGSLSMWIIRLIASNKTAFLALECCTFLDLGGSCALFKMVSRHSVNLVLTAGSSVEKYKK